MSSPPDPEEAAITSSHDIVDASTSPSTSTGQPPQIDDQAASNPAPLPMSTPAQETTTPNNPDATAPPPGDENQPRIPWHGPIPSFFVMGSNGSLMPHFHAGPRPMSTGPPPMDRDSPSPAPSAVRPPPPQSFPFPGFTPMPSGPNPFFSFLFASGSRPNRPDPEAAAELLRSLPTVSRGLFRRVENVIKAEQDKDVEEEENRGWKCGICLEGVEEDVKETGVTVLPCNHLFHRDCLEPWFRTKHTCPTCRLNLDPGKTLRRNPEPGPRRPGATGSGRQSPHPYSRTPSHQNLTNLSTELVESERENTPSPLGTTDPTGAARHEINLEEVNNGAGGFTFFWRMPVPDLGAGSTQPSTPQPPADAEPTDPASTAGLSPAIPTTIASPALPHPVNMPLTSSPIALSSGLGGSPSPEPGMAGDNQAAHLDARPQPERRPHFNIIHHHHLPSPGPHHHHIPTSPHHHHHIHHHHHHLRPPGASTPFPAPSTPPPAPDQAGPTSDTPGASSLPPSSSTPIAAANAEPANPNDDNITPEVDGTTAPGSVPPPSQEDRNVPHFHFFFNFSDGGPLFTPPFPPPPAPQAAQESEQPPTVPIERPSLTAWVEERERRLGWRCDAPDCGIAPTDDDVDDVPMFLEGDKEMISIYSSNQPPLSVLLKEGHGDSRETKGTIDSDRSFELHACEHRWHRACLESVELSAGRLMRTDEQGRCWVRCERCRADGWVKCRTRSMSEREVERMMVGA